MRDYSPFLSCTPLLVLSTTKALFHQLMPELTPFYSRHYRSRLCYWLERKDEPCMNKSKRHVGTHTHRDGIPLRRPGTTLPEKWRLHATEDRALFHYRLADFILLRSDM